MSMDVGPMEVIRTEHDFSLGLQTDLTFSETVSGTNKFFMSSNAKFDFCSMAFQAVF